jgi:glycosyltransferase involved in cell wall biosynthesis
MKKILIIDHTNNFGGGQRVLINLINSLCEKYAITVLIPTGGKLIGKLQRAISNNIVIMTYNSFASEDKNISKLIYLIMDNISVLIFIIKNYNIINEYNIIYINGSRVMLPFLILKMIIKYKLFFHIHLNYNKIAMNFLAILNKLHAIDKLIFCSNFTLKKFKDSSIIKNLPNTFLLNNSLDSQKGKIKFRDIFWSSQIKIWNIAVIGNIIHEKGQDTIIELAELVDNINIYFIGKSDNSDYLIKLKNKSKSKSNIFFIGETDDINAIINDLSISISIIPSRWEEPFGLVAIESMANSCITFSTQRGGLVDIINSTSMIPFNSVYDLSMKIKNLQLKTIDDLKEIAHYQFINVNKNYTLENFKINLLSILRDIN